MYIINIDSVSYWHSLCETLSTEVVYDVWNISYPEPISINEYYVYVTNMTVDGYKSELYDYLEKESIPCSRVRFYLIDFGFILVVSTKRRDI